MKRSIIENLMREYMTTNGEIHNEDDAMDFGYYMYCKGMERVVELAKKYIVD